MFGDNELIYLYFQGNEDCYEELRNRYDLMIEQTISNCRRMLNKGGFDNQECRSYCEEAFMKSVYWYSESKDVLFQTFLSNNLQYSMRNYRKRLINIYSRENYYDDKAFTKMIEKYSNSINFSNKAAIKIEYFEFMTTIKDLIEKMTGIEKEVAMLLITGLDSEAIMKITNYPKRTVSNAIYRIRNKFKRFIQKN